MNIITFGSCMSEGILSQIQPLISEKIIHLNHVIHNRTDYFIDAFISRSSQPSNINSLNYADVSSSLDFPGSDLIDLCQFYIDNQSSDKIGINKIQGRVSFFENISNASIDMIICDNFMDISSKIVYDLNHLNKYFLFSGAFSDCVFKKNFNWLDFLTPEASLFNWKAIFDWFMHKQPQARIVFFPFPASVHGHNDRHSLVRNRDFITLIKKEDFKSIIVVEPDDVTSDYMLNPNDWCHYSPSYYKKNIQKIIKHL